MTPDEIPEPKAPTPKPPAAKAFKSKDPMHGVTLEQALTELVDYFGWQALSRMIPARCFYNLPSISSSLRFLRQTPWARDKVENTYRWYVRRFHDKTDTSALPPE